jgi:hypothetical protein
MKNLQNFGIQELNVEEIREIQGGGWFSDTFSDEIDAVQSFFGGILSYALNTDTSMYPQGPKGCLGGN